jgi:hypothetical protein
MVLKFSYWLKENGSINQSMPELSQEETPKGKDICSQPYTGPDDYPPVIKKTKKKKKY